LGDLRHHGGRIFEADLRIREAVSRGGGCAGRSGAVPTLV
jgi:hypothetical protein